MTRTTRHQHDGTVVLTVESLDFELRTDRIWDPLRRTAGEEITETDLRYTFFQALVTFEVNGTVVLGPRRRVTFFHFLTCLADVLTALPAGREAVISLTESEDRVLVRPTGELLLPDDGGTVAADRTALLEEFDRFLASGRAQLAANVPGLDRNPEFAKLSPP